MYVCVVMHMCVCGCKNPWMWMPFVDIQCLSQWLSTKFSGIESHIDHRAHQFTRLDGQQDPRALPSQCPSFSIKYLGP